MYLLQHNIKLDIVSQNVASDGSCVVGTRSKTGALLMEGDGHKSGGEAIQGDHKRSV